MFFVPSILEKKAENYYFQIKRLSRYFSTFQVDIADGQYVSSKTASLKEILTTFLKDKDLIKKIILDFHLMVKDYRSEIKRIVNFKRKIKLGKIFIHFNLYPDHNKLVNLYYKNIGLVLNPEDEVKGLANYYNLKKIKWLQIMSVYPGSQGQPFIKETLNKITQLRQLGYKYKIYLDGGVNEKTLLIIFKKKFIPDVACLGSYLTKAKDVELTKRIEYLTKSKINSL